MTSRIDILTAIDAPLQEVFDLARDIDLHVETMAHTNEKAVGGTTSGLIGLGEHVTWQGRHFGITQRFTSRITAFDPPRYFRDEMTRGAFKSFGHDHYFEPIDGDPDRTLMRDVVEFSAPLGFLGRLVSHLILEDYLRRLLMLRNRTIKVAAERKNRP